MGYSHMVRMMLYLKRKFAWGLTLPSDSVSQRRETYINKGLGKIENWR
jgi:hypothetical protein